MIVYVSITIFMILLLFIGEFKNSILKKISEGLIILFFFGVAGFSYKIHNDMYAYESFFNGINISNWKEIPYEKGFVLLSYIFSKIFKFPIFKAVIYGINSLIIYKGINALIKKKEVRFFFLLFYLTSNFYMLYAVSLRQAIAVSIFIYSLKFIEEKNYYRYLVCIILATLFHKSAIILLLFPIILLPFKNTICLDFGYLFMVLILSYTNALNHFLILIVLKLGDKIPKLKSYGQGIILNGRFGINSIIMTILLVIIVIIYNTKYLLPTFREKLIYRGFLFFYFVFCLQGKISIMFRVILYFYAFFPLGIIFIFRKLKSNSYLIIFKYLFLFLFSLLFNLRVIMIRYKEDYRYIPYHSYLEKIFYNIPYEETAQYRHMIERHGKAHIDFIKKYKK